MALVLAYFRFTHLLGRPRYVGDVFLYLCTERIEVRVTVCVIVLYCKYVVCGMMMMMKGWEKMKPGAGT